MMKPYYEENNIKIYNSDIMPTLKEMADESVDCAVTSPPYWALRDYGIEPSIWDRDEKCHHKWGVGIKTKRESHHGEGKSTLRDGNVSPNENWNKGAKGDGQLSSFCSLCNAWHGSLGLEPTFELYIKHLCDIFDEVKRVLKKTGTCWVNLGDTYRGTKVGNTESRKNPNVVTDSFKKSGGQEKSLCQIPNRFSIEMTNREWILRNELIWHKPNCMPSSATDRFTVDFEKIFFFVKDKKYWFERQFEVNKYDGRKNTTLKPTNKYPSGRSGGLHHPQKNDREPMERWPNSQGRNKRCVWKITTQPFKEAHFAVFPESLVETPIKSGCPEFVCNKCGKAKEKIYKITKPPEEMYTKSNLPDDGLINAGMRNNGKFRGSGQKVQNWKDQNPNQSKGYTSCKCKAGFSGGVVLDPFMGSGTVAAVAKRLNRQFIGIDIKKDYCKMAIKRIKNTEKDMFV